MKKNKYFCPGAQNGWWIRTEIYRFHVKSVGPLIDISQNFQVTVFADS